MTNNFYYNADRQTDNSLEQLKICNISFL